MSESSFSEEINEFETHRSLNGIISRAKLNAQLGPLRDCEEEFTLEGWCRNGKISKTLLEENNDLSGFSDESWIAEEDNKSVFKNALAVLSDRLALMHRKGFANRPVSEIAKPVRNVKVNTKTIPSLKRKISQLPEGRASEGYQDKGRISLTDITQDTEQLPPLIKIKEASNSSRASLHFPSFELKSNPHDIMLQDFAISIQDTASHTVTKDLGENMAKTCCEIDSEKLVLSEKLPKTWSNLDHDQSQKSEAHQAVVVYEYVLKPAKPSASNPSGGPLSQKGIEMLIAPKPNPLFHKNYNPPPIEFKPTNTFKLGALNCSDDQKVNKSFLASKRIISPANASKASKVDTATIMPHLKTQKAVLQTKEIPNHSLQIKSNGGLKSKENDINGLKNAFVLKKQIELKTLESEESKGNLRAILGQVLNDTRENTSYNLDLKESKQQLEKEMPESIESQGKSIDYFLSLYKLGAEKALEKPKLMDQSMTGGYKVTNFLKNLAEIQPKPKQFNQLESLNNSLFGKDKSLKTKDLSQRQSVKSSQSRNEVIFRLRKMKASYDNKLSIV